MSMVGRRLSAVVAMAVLTPLALSACSEDNAAASDWVEPRPSAAGSGSPASAAPSASAPSAPAGPLALALTPADGKKNVPVSAEIGVKLTGGEIKSVVLKDADGKTVKGELREDGSSWVPAAPLKTTKRYVATVTAADPAGVTQEKKVSFTTMGAPARRTGTGMYLFDDRTYGVAMPVVAEFNPGVKKADRAGVQKRMFVKTDPPQPGTWSWTESGTQAYYRAPKYWQTGTKLTVRLALGGTPTGNGRYGDQDRSASVKIGRSFEMNVDNATKKMTVVQDGKTIKTIPVSLGKKSTPSSSGTMVVMDKLESTVFDTTDTDGAAGYRTNIDYAQRLTWSGQYIHSAPWSVENQGRTNVSHGCVNVSPANALWLFQKSLIGDPVKVKGTSDKLAYGNGWTPWDLTWEQFAKNSALPVSADLG